MNMEDKINPHPLKYKLEDYYNMFRIGDYVKCINDDPHARLGPNSETLCKGKIYQIFDIVQTFTGLELTVIPHGFSWRANRFEPSSSSESNSIDYFQINKECSSI